MEENLHLFFFFFCNFASRTVSRSLNQSVYVLLLFPWRKNLYYLRSCSREIRPNFENSSINTLSFFFLHKHLKTFHSLGPCMCRGSSKGILRLFSGQIALSLLFSCLGIFLGLDTWDHFHMTMTEASFLKKSKLQRAKPIRVETLCLSRSLRTAEEPMMLVSCSIKTCISPVRWCHHCLLSHWHKTTQHEKKLISFNNSSSLLFFC